MAENNVNPRSMPESTGIIVKSQSHFDAGVFNDIPASTCPDNGVFKLVNLINYGNRLVGRPGSKRWSNTTLPSLRTGYSLSKTGTTVTKTVGTDFTSDDIGNYIVHDDGAHERITAYTSAAVVTVHSSTARAASTSAWVRSPVNGMYFHKTESKHILHIGTKLYYASDIDISAWTEIYCASVDALANGESTFGEIGQYVVIFNSGGIYKADLSSSPVIYYKTNTSVPTIAISNANTQGVSYPYGRRYVYSMLRLSGDGPRDRTTDGVVVEQETGTNKVDSDYRDYGERWVASEIDTTNPATGIGTLTVPVDSLDDTKPQTHYTHFGVYGTMDIGDNGYDGTTGIGNNPNVYVWVADIPIVKTFVASRSGTTVTSTVGTFSQNDIGSVIIFQDGTSATIASYTDTTNVETTTSGDISSQPAGIGCGAVSKIITASKALQVVTRTAGSVFASTDVGKTIFWGDGTSDVIHTYTDANTVSVSSSGTISSTVAICNPVSRAFADNVSDDDLRTRIAYYALKTRFWTNMPSSNLGVVVPGFIFCATRGDSNIYYCQLKDGALSLAGFYHAGFQYSRVDDAVQAISRFPDKVVLYCSNSTHSLFTNEYDLRELPEVGESIAIITSQNTDDHNVGIIDYGTLQHIDFGIDIMVSSDYGIRMFDGVKFTENIAENRIMNRMRQMNSAMASSYDPINGYIIWGLNE